MRNPQGAPFAKYPFSFPPGGHLVDGQASRAVPGRHSLLRAMGRERPLQPSGREPPAFRVLRVRDGPPALLQGRPRQVDPAGEHGQGPLLGGRLRGPRAVVRPSGPRRWNRNPRPQPQELSKSVFLTKFSQSHIFSKLVIWGRGFRFHWSLRCGVYHYYYYYC